MNTDWHLLYQEIILDHNRYPRNQHAMEDATLQAKGYNPLCGDKLTVYVKLDQDRIVDVSFVGCGCAISQASASLMTEAILGKTLQDAHALFSHFHEMLTLDVVPVAQDLGKLEALRGVKAFPARVKCATLAWHTLEAALKKEGTVVSTEQDDDRF